jgi:hypothetical protein
MAREILKQPGVRQALKALALEAIRAAWQSMRQWARVDLDDRHRDERTMIHDPTIDSLYQRA